MSKPILDLLRNFNPGMKLNKIFMTGTEIHLSSFVSYNETTKLVTFISAEGNTLVVNGDEIHAIEISNK